MQPNSRLNTALAVLLLVATLVGGVLVAPAPAGAQQAPADWDIPGGHFFTQTGKGNQSGFALTDDNGVAFWSEFKRLGGVNVLGYPVSGRFLWNGFVCQAMQRVVLQWDKDAKAANFVNVFDLMHDTGKDAWLETVRQTPKPKTFNEQGLGWEQIVQQRLAVLEANPAIKKAYFAVVGGDPVTMNGLPTTDVVDMGDTFIVRAQRVVIQQWKKDVPWAKAGQVTFGLGGSIARESGLLPGGVDAHVAQKVINEKNNRFRIMAPTGWITVVGDDRITLTNLQSALSANPQNAPQIQARTEANEGNMTFSDLKTTITSDLYRELMSAIIPEFRMIAITDTMLAGEPALRMVYSGKVKGQMIIGGEYMTIKGNRLIDVAVATLEGDFAKYEATWDVVAASFALLSTSTP